MLQESLRKSSSYEVTIADMARRSERRAWRIAAAATLMSLMLGAGYFYFLPLKEKVPYLVMADAYSLFVQSYDRLKQLGRILGFAGEANYVNAAACLAVQAKAGGLMQVDHVMQGGDGRNLIVVQGRVDDPANRWTSIDKGLAAEQSMHLSTLQMDNMRQKQQAGPSLQEKEGLAMGR